MRAVERLEQQMHARDRGDSSSSGVVLTISATPSASTASLSGPVRNDAHPPQRASVHASTDTGGTLFASADDTPTNRDSNIASL